MHTAAEASAALCPVCKIGLVRSDRQGIEIDRCPQCRGIWLDRGQLDKIIARSGPEIVPSPVPPAPLQERLPWGEDRYADAGFHAGTRMEQRAKRRRQSWLESLFG